MMTAADLLRQRLTLVSDISALIADTLKLSQSLAGAEMEILRIELEMTRNGASEQLVRDLREAESSAAAIRAAQDECEENIAEVERAVAQVDQLLAAADSK